MNDKQYTPGPWKVIDMPILPLVWIGEQDGTTIATVANRDEINANAKLIAAAPKMYELLCELLATEYNQEVQELILEINGPEGFRN